MTRKAEHSDLRISDEDRSATAERLRLAVDEGRLDLADYDERLRSTYSASTYGQLDLVTSDLPTVPTARLPSTERARAEADRREWLGEWRSWLGGAVILTVIWGTTSLVAGELTEFWPIIPLGIWAAVLLVSAIGGRRDGSCRATPPR